MWRFSEKKKSFFNAKVDVIRTKSQILERWVRTSHQSSQKFSVTLNLCCARQPLKFSSLLCPRISRLVAVRKSQSSVVQWKNWWIPALELLVLALPCVSCQGCVVQNTNGVHWMCRVSDKPKWLVRPLDRWVEQSSCSCNPETLWRWQSMPPWIRQDPWPRFYC